MRRPSIVVAAAALGILVACVWGRVSESEAVGTYELTSASGKILLELRSDGSFEESVTFSSGRKSLQDGRWWIASEGDRYVNFDNLWIPREFAPDYINAEEDEPNPSGLPKFSEPGHRSISIYRWLGTVYISVYADGDVEFEKL